MALVFLLCRQPAARADAELRIGWGALERLVAEHAFTDEGRHYLRGGKEAKCGFAYLENPRVDTEEGRLRLKAQFTGRSRVNLFGMCVGPGDSFEVTILAMPQYRDGAIAFDNVEVYITAMPATVIMFARCVRT